MSLDKNGVVKLSIFYRADGSVFSVVDKQTGLAWMDGTSEGDESRLFLQGSAKVVFPGKPNREYVKTEDVCTIPVDRSALTRDVQRNLTYVLHEPSDRL